MRFPFDDQLPGTSSPPGFDVIWVSPPPSDERIVWMPFRLPSSLNVSQRSSVPSGDGIPHGLKSVGYWPFAPRGAAPADTTATAASATASSTTKRARPLMRNLMSPPSPPLGNGRGSGPATAVRSRAQRRASYERDKQSSSPRMSQNHRSYLSR